MLWNHTQCKAFIELLFNPTTWIDQAVSSYGMDDPDVYFEEADELGPDLETERP